MNKTKWSKLKSPHGAYNLLGADKAPKGKARKTLTLLLWGGACSPRRVQGRVAVKVRTDRRRRDKHTDVIHCYRWNGCLSQIIDDKHLTRRREETKPGEVKGGKPKTHKKKRERETHTQKLLISRPGWVKDKELEIRAPMKFTVQAHTQLLY